MFRTNSKDTPRSVTTSVIRFRPFREWSILEPHQNLGSDLYRIHESSQITRLELESHRPSKSLCPNTPPRLGYPRRLPNTDGVLLSRTSTSYQPTGPLTGEVVDPSTRSETPDHFQEEYILHRHTSPSPLPRRDFQHRRHFTSRVPPAPRPFGTQDLDKGLRSEIRWYTSP